MVRVPVLRAPSAPEPRRLRGRGDDGAQPKLGIIAAAVVVCLVLFFICLYIRMWNKDHGRPCHRSRSSQRDPDRRGGRRAWHGHRNRDRPKATGHGGDHTRPDAPPGPETVITVNNADRPDPDVHIEQVDILQVPRASRARWEPS